MAAFILAGMDGVCQGLYAKVTELHPWLPVPNVEAALVRSDAILDPATCGGTALEVGSILHQWDTKRYDGIVMASCWGCDNSLVTESLLRYHKDIPL